MGTTRWFSIILEPGKIMLSETTSPHCNVSHRKSSIGLMSECFSERPRMCYNNGGMSGMDTTLQVNIHQSIIPNVPNVFTPVPFHTALTTSLRFVESNLIQRVNYGGIHRIIGNKSFGQLT